MKKCLKFFYVALFAVLTLSVTSCKDDDEPNGNSIVGTWQNNDAIAGSLGVTQYVKFEEGGKYYEVNVYPKEFGGEVDVLHGNWSQSGDKIKISGGNVASSTATIKSQKGNKLVLEVHGISQEYKKVSDSTIDKYLEDYK